MQLNLILLALPGVVQAIHSLPLAKVLHELGAGRTQPDQAVNWTVGIELLKIVGDKVNKGKCALHKGPPRKLPGGREM